MSLLDEPIPLPSGKTRTDLVSARVAKIRHLIATKQLLARLANCPEWPEMRKLASNLVSEMEEDLLTADEPKDIFRLQGGILSLSEFLESPDRVSEQVAKLTKEMETLEDQLVKLTGL